jgi:hypothetical protein
LRWRSFCLPRLPAGYICWAQDAQSIRFAPNVIRLPPAERLNEARAIILPAFSSAEPDDEQR